MIVRAGHEVRSPTVEARRVTEPAEQIEVSVDRRGKRALDSFWPSRRPARVVHATASGAVEVERCIPGGNRTVVEFAADIDHRRRRAGARECEVIGIGEHGAHAGIREYVRNLIGREVGIDRH